MYLFLKQTTGSVLEDIKTSILHLLLLCQIFHVFFIPSAFRHFFFLGFFSVKGENDMSDYIPSHLFQVTVYSYPQILLSPFPVKNVFSWLFMASVHLEWQQLL